MVIKIAESFIFSIFDQIKGPEILYSSLKQTDIARDIVVRSFVALGLSHKDFETTELVLPIFLNKTDQSHVVFSLFFHIPISDQQKKNDEDIACISWVVSKENETMFFTRIPAIRESSKHLIHVIRNHIESNGLKKTKLGKIFQQEIESIETVILRNYRKTTIVEETQEIILSKKDLPSLKSEYRKTEVLNYLKSIPPDSLVFLVQAAILGKPILIIGDKKSFDLLSDALLCFNFRGVSRKNYLENSITIGDNNAIGVPPGLEIPKNVYKLFYVVYFADKKRLKTKKGIKEMQFARMWSSNILLSTSFDDLIENYHEYLSSKVFYASKILYTLAQGKDSKENIEKTKKLILNFRKTLPKADYEFIIELAVANNPFLEEFMRKELFAERFVLYGW